jgi:hypothetical protein
MVQLITGCPLEIMGWIRLSAHCGCIHCGGFDMASTGQAVTPIRDEDVRATLQRHWSASDGNDFVAER